jgi:hypothetical protein
MSIVIEVDCHKNNNLINIRTIVDNHLSTITSNTIERFCLVEIKREVQLIVNKKQQQMKSSN